MNTNGVIPTFTAMMLLCVVCFSRSEGQQFTCCVYCDYQYKGGFDCPVGAAGECCDGTGGFYDPPCEDGHWFCQAVSIYWHGDAGPVCAEPGSGPYAVWHENTVIVGFDVWFSKCKENPAELPACDVWADPNGPYPATTQTCGNCPV